MAGGDELLPGEVLQRFGAGPYLMLLMLLEVLEKILRNGISTISIDAPAPANSVPKALRGERCYKLKTKIAPPCAPT